MVERFKYFIKIFLCLFLSYFFIELVFKIITFKNILEWSVLRILVFNFSSSLLISFILSFFKEKVVKIIILVLVLFSGIYTITEMGFNNFMGNYMSFNAAGDGIGRVSEYVLEFIRYIRLEYYLCLIPFIILLIIFIKKKNILTYTKYDYKQRAFLAVIIVFAYLLGYGTLIFPFMQNPNQIKSNLKLYYEPTLLELSLRQFGTNKFLIRDLVYMILPHNNESEIIIEEEEKQEQIIEEESNIREIDDSKWQELMNSETDESIKQLDEFYMSQNITSKNAYTGIFENKNLILIMIEAFDTIAINEEVAPTLYKMATEGFYFDNYYTPKYSCTTGESEYIGLTSIIPSATVCTPNTYRNNTYTDTIFNLFNNKGYYSSSYHNWNDQYYNRTVLHQNMGSDKFYDVEDLEIKIIQGWQSDYDLMVKAMPHFISQDKFFSFIVTSSMHFPYDVDSTVVRRNWDKVKNLNYSTKIKRYLAKVAELDKGLEYLLAELQNQNKLDDTVIVLFGDHHPLKMGLSELNNASTFNRYEGFNEDRLPFIIYNSKTKGEVISTTSSTFDILPTLANMFNLDYDPRLYVGKDIFSDDEKIVIFTNGSWATDKALYFSSTSKYEALQDGVTEEYINSINTKVSNWFTVSDLTLRKDYFKYRGER